MTTNKPTVSNENECLTCGKVVTRFIIFCDVECKQSYYDKQRAKLQIGKNKRGDI